MLLIVNLKLLNKFINFFIKDFCRNKMGFSLILIPYHIGTLGSLSHFVSPLTAISFKVLDSDAFVAITTFPQISCGILFLYKIL